MPRPPFADSDASTRMQNTLDGGAPFYNVYDCADGKWMSVACIEPKFYQIFLERFLAALPPGFLHNQAKDLPTVHEQMDRHTWPQTQVFLENGFRCYNRKHWEDVFSGMYFT